MDSHGLVVVSQPVAPYKRIKPALARSAWAGFLCLNGGEEGY